MNLNARSQWKALAVDLGASSGRVVTTVFDGGKIFLDEIHRFEISPIDVCPHLYTNILQIYKDILFGLHRAWKQEGFIHSLAIDSWGSDFGLLDRHGKLIGNPVYYRDRRTDGIIEKTLSIMDKKEIYRETGIHFMPFNTIYQLLALARDRDSSLDIAETLLLLPDLLNYFLSGVKSTEFTNATTTQLVNASTRNWSSSLMKKLEIPANLLTEIVQPGTVIGRIRENVGYFGESGIRIVASASHDTASAVAAVPATSNNFAYLSCGTWSLLGTEMDQPVLNEAAMRNNFTNEGGVNGTFRLLRNIMGLWLLQQFLEERKNQGFTPDWRKILELVKSATPFVSLIDPDDISFISLGAIVERIQKFCLRTNQPKPETDGAILRCILESLAFKYRWALELLEVLASRKFTEIHMVGGGIQNNLLCQWTADATGRMVKAGPVEASAIGNGLVQLLAAGEIGTIWEGREIVSRSFKGAVYEPGETSSWDAHYGRFLKILT